MSSFLDSIRLLSLSQKIGQLFFIGIPGPEFDEATQKLVSEISPGGVCLFARNIKNAAQTRELLDSVRDALTVEPFLSIDQEGGLVDRLRRVMTPMPAANKIRTKAEATELGQIISGTLRILGFNMDFAPVVDVVDGSRSQVSNGLFSRTFGSSPEEVIELANSFLAALQDGGCMGCLKHFPGLGASEVDSHEELPNVNITQDDLEHTDLLPYKKLLTPDAQAAVMVGHACYPKLDLQEKDQNGKLLPSSLSGNVISRLLRTDLGFDGVVITDDLEMGAIVKNYGIGDACRMAFSAGADMLAICAGVDSICEGFSAISAAIKDGEISEGRLDESLRRISVAKTLLKRPLTFDPVGIESLSNKVAELNARLR